MFETHIYIETDSKSPKVTEKKYGYVLEVVINGECKTRQGFGTTKGTYHKAVLQAMIEAIQRFNQSCAIHIHAEDDFVLSMFEKNLHAWAGNDFRTSKGKPVTNEEEWRTLWELQSKHLIRVEKGVHSYSNWLQGELRKEK